MWAQKLVAPGKFSTVEIPRPTANDLGNGEVLLRVLAGGICGSDLPNFAGRISLAVDGDSLPNAAGIPGYPMHEVVGEVLVSRSPGIEPGMNVVGWASQTNALAETIITNGDGVNRYDNSFSPTQAIMIQPLACVLFTLGQLGDISGRRVAVLGLGPIGLLFSHAAKSAGASRVVGVDRVDRSASARQFGIDEFVHSSSDRWAANLRDEDRPDVVIEAIGHQVGTLTDSIEAVAFGGRVFYFGIPDDFVYPFPMYTLLRKNMAVMSGFVTPPFRRDAITAANDYLLKHSDLCEPFVTDVFPFESTELAYVVANVPKTGRHKVVVTMERR